TPPQESDRSIVDRCRRAGRRRHTFRSANTKSSWPFKSRQLLVIDNSTKTDDGQPLCSSSQRILHLRQPGYSRSQYWWLTRPGAIYHPFPLRTLQPEPLRRFRRRC
ncbi:hypothetical protein BC937DRAFT_90827, partial [Endogone sp. FLAS-F59071]